LSIINEFEVSHFGMINLMNLKLVKNNPKSLNIIQNEDSSILKKYF